MTLEAIFPMIAVENPAGRIRVRKTFSDRPLVAGKNISEIA